jgi:hypothetical protein
LRPDYGTSVSLLSVEDDGVNPAFHTSHTACLRSILAEERDHISGQIFKTLDELRRCRSTGAASEIEGARDDLRSLEADVAYLDDVIARLDHQIATSSSFQASRRHTRSVATG